MLSYQYFHRQAIDVENRNKTREWRRCRETNILQEKSIFAFFYSLQLAFIDNTID